MAYWYTGSAFFQIPQSYLNTDENWSFKISALVELSVNVSLPFSIDGTPLCSFLLALMYDQNFLEP